MDSTTQDLHKKICAYYTVSIVVLNIAWRNSTSRNSDSELLSCRQQAIWQFVWTGTPHVIKVNFVLFTLSCCAGEKKILNSVQMSPVISKTSITRTAPSSSIRKWWYWLISNGTEVRTTPGTGPVQALLLILSTPHLPLSLPHPSGSFLILPLSPHLCQWMSLIRASIRVQRAQENEA